MSRDTNTEPERIHAILLELAENATNLDLEKLAMGAMIILAQHFRRPTGFSVMLENSDGSALPAAIAIVIGPDVRRLDAVLCAAFGPAEPEAQT